MKQAGSSFAKCVAFLLVAAFPFGISTPVESQTQIPAGFDLFATDPLMTQFQFTGQLQIPRDFFESGSQQFRGTVGFKGVPIESFMGRDIGRADTIIERKEPATLPTDTVPIELVALSLQSVEPITVRVGTTNQLWDVQATISPTRPSEGTMTIRANNSKGGLGGGTFDSELPVFPLFTFIRQSDGEQRMFDVGELSLSSLTRSQLTLKTTRTPWVDTCPPPALDSDLHPGFCASATAEGRIRTVQSASLQMHTLRPAPAPALLEFFFSNTEAEITIQLLGKDAAQFTLTVAGWAYAEVLNEPGDPGDGLDQVPTQISWSLEGNSPELGVVSIITCDQIPDNLVLSTGIIKENQNTEPGRLDVPPFAESGTVNSLIHANLSVRVFDIDHPKIAPQPLYLVGATRWPPGHDENYFSDEPGIYRNAAGQQLSLEIKQLVLKNC